MPTHPKSCPSILKHIFITTQSSFMRTSPQVVSYIIDHAHVHYFKSQNIYKVPNIHITIILGMLSKNNPHTQQST